MYNLLKAVNFSMYHAVSLRWVLILSGVPTTTSLHQSDSK
jgi:hypothetical protein